MYPRYFSCLLCKYIADYYKDKTTNILWCTFKVYNLSTKHIDQTVWICLSALFLFSHSNLSCCVTNPTMALHLAWESAQPESIHWASWITMGLSFLNADTQDRSNCANAQADQRFLWAHCPNLWFCLAAAYFISKV